MFEFKLPDLGEGVHEGEILDWFVSPGDEIKEDDPLVEIETDKAAVTIPSPKAGKVVSTTGGVGETIAVGAVLVVIATNGAAASDSDGVAVETASASRAPAADNTTSEIATSAPSPSAPSPSTPSGPVTQVPPEKAAPISQQARVAAMPTAAPALAATTGATGPVPAAPATRRLARELGVSLQAVAGSGPAGRVTREDVQRHAEGGATPGQPAAEEPVGASATPAATSFAPGQSGIPFFEVESLPHFEQWGEVTREPLRSIRRKVAHKMVASMTIVPHVAHMDECDVTELDAFRRSLNGRNKEARYSLLPFIIKAAVSQLKHFPKINASIDPHREEIVYKRFFNIGFAADTPKGLMVPVIHDVDRLSVAEVNSQMIELAGQAREGKLDIKKMQGGTFTVTNLGSIGGTFVIPTINYPEVAILGLGRAMDKPVVHEGAVAVRKMLPMTIAYDHRLVDGADAARFLNAVIERLQDPPRLLVEV